MTSRQASGPEKRWSEALLGGMAGLGARVLLAGAGRLLGFKSGPVAVVGGVAGVVGALVGGGLARRQRRPELRVIAKHEVREDSLEWEDEVTPLRGPNGRERYPYMQEASSHTA
ncbi:MAG TPA: hypothetical protein VK539_25110 [Myxococcaceae bacterium]|nr:hypothetical protein [Myxococcaceae bacterium]